jgi:hypothetical protein
MNIVVNTVATRIFFIASLFFRVLTIILIIVAISLYNSGKNPDLLSNIENIVFIICLSLTLLFNSVELVNFIQTKINGVTSTIQNPQDAINSVLTNQETQGKMIQIVIILSILSGIAFSLYYASTDPSALTSKKYVYSMMAIGFLILLFGLVTPILKDATDPMTRIILIGALFVFILGVIYFYSNANTTTIVALGYIMNILMGLIAIGALAIFFYVFSNYLKSLDGISGFVIYFLFYIPCLLVEFVQYVINDLKMTTSPVYILFVLEIVFVLLYIYVPKLINLIIQKDGMALLPGVAFLDISNIICNATQLQMPISSTNDGSVITYRTSYSISMWIYLNSQPTNYVAYAKETPIFNYGNGKPKITYYNNVESSNPDEVDKLLIYFTDVDGIAPYKVTIPKQNWNQVVFNYSSIQADLFINGNLEHTYIFNNDMPTYQSTDFITVGESNGLDGAICNVKYHTSPLTKFQIANSYNLLMNKNPPIINL